MKNILSAFALLAITTSALAEVTISQAWVRSTAPGQPVGAAYMQLVSDSDTVLVGASSPVANTVEMHEMSMNGDVMKMRQLKQIALKAGQKVTLEPGGSHLMLIDVKHQIKPDEIVPIQLEFKDKSGKTSSVDLKVKAQKAAD